MSYLINRDACCGLESRVLAELNLEITPISVQMNGKWELHNQWGLEMHWKSKSSQKVSHLKLILPLDY